MFSKVHTNCHQFAWSHVLLNSFGLLSCDYLNSESGDSLNLRTLWSWNTGFTCFVGAWLESITRKGSWARSNTLLGPTMCVCCTWHDKLRGAMEDVVILCGRMYTVLWSWDQINPMIDKSDPSKITLVHRRHQFKNNKNTK